MRASSCHGSANRLSTMLGAMRRISEALSSHGDDDDDDGFVHNNDDDDCDKNSDV